MTCRASTAHVSRSVVTWCMNGLSNLDDTYTEYSLAPNGPRSKVKVTAGLRSGERIFVDTGASSPSSFFRYFSKQYSFWQYTWTNKIYSAIKGVYQEKYSWIQKIRILASCLVSVIYLFYDTLLFINRHSNDVYFSSLQGGSKIVTFCHILYQILTDFQNYFTVRISRKFAIKIPPHLSCIATLPCEMSSVLKSTIENKTTSVTTHFKKLTTWNNVFIILSYCPK